MLMVKRVGGSDPRLLQEDLPVVVDPGLDAVDEVIALSGLNRCRNLPWDIRYSSTGFFAAGLLAIAALGPESL